MIEIRVTMAKVIGDITNPINIMDVEDPIQSASMEYVWDPVYKALFNIRETVYRPGMQRFRLTS